LLEKGFSGVNIEKSIDWKKAMFTHLRPLLDKVKQRKCELVNVERGRRE